MKKIKLNPLELDKETVALLNTRQIQSIIGGRAVAGASTRCCGGVSVCDSSGTSTGCGAGSSQCFAA